MCGICGYKGIKNDTKHRNLVKDMLNTLIHRGPDDWGIYNDDDIALGHRRLSILDLKTGKQPIYNEDKSVVIVFNGEIYNFKELSKELKKKGHKFYTKTDTEVIIHAYEEYGLDCLSKFNGMFAFALWDKKKKKLFLARDRLGTKPLYYYKKGDTFIFASEAKAILEYKNYKTDYDPRAIIDYFTYHYITGDKTYFKDIHLLQPGYYMLISRDKYEIKKFWELHCTPKKFENPPLKFKTILKDSIKRQLVSDVEVGSTLSGGFDSSSVATIASKLVNRKLSVFTIGFVDGARYDERPLANKVSEKLNVNVFENVILGKRLPPICKKLIYFLDDPRNGAPIFSIYLLSQLVSSKVKVVLTGLGGDELFAGYHVFKSYNYLDKLLKNPLRAFLLPFLFKSHEFYRGMYFVGFPFFDKEVRRTGLFVVFSKSQRKKLFTKNFYEKIKNYDPSDIRELPNTSSFVKKAIHAYTKIYLPTSLLVQDKMGMAHSIEARMPICDNELLDFSLSLSIDDKLTNGEMKYIIKEGLKKDLPKDLYNKPKKGFPTPFAIWFKKELRNFLYNLLLDKRTIERGIFNPKYVKKLLDRYTKPAKDNPLSLIGVNKIWSLVITELWFRVFIDGEKDLLREENLKRYKEQII